MSVEEMLAESNDSVRHGRQISEEELESAVEFVLATRCITPCSHPEWSFQDIGSSSNFIKQIDPITGALRSRSWIKLYQIPPQVIFCCLFDTKYRLEFDRFYKRFEISRKINDRLDILISEVETPVGISNREFVEWRHCRLPTFEDPVIGRENVQYVIYLRSCNDDECSSEVRPNSRKVERAEVWLSCYVIQWWLDENGRATGTELIVMSQIDSRGSIPKFIANSAAAHSPSKWMRSISEFAKRIVSDKHIEIESMSDKEIENVLGLRSLISNRNSRLGPIESN
jgi:hypothetical protein